MNNKLKASLIVLGVLFIGVGAVKASPLGFWDKVADLVAQRLSGMVGAPEKEGVLGGVQTTAINVTDPNITTNQDSGYYWGNLEVRGNTFMDSTSTYGSTSATSLGISESVRTGSLATGTTTLFCQLNPFAATSTVTTAILNTLTNPTSSAYVSYVTSTTQYPVPTSITTSTQALITDVQVLGGTVSSTPYVRAGSIVSEGVTVASTNASITLAPNSYVCGIVKAGAGLSGTASLGGFTSGNSTLTGKYSLRFTKLN